MAKTTPTPSSDFLREHYQVTGTYRREFVEPHLLAGLVLEDYQVHHADAAHAAKWLAAVNAQEAAGKLHHKTTQLALDENFSK